MFISLLWSTWKYNTDIKIMCINVQNGVELAYEFGNQM